MRFGEKVWVSWATKFCARWSSPTGNPEHSLRLGDGSELGSLIDQVTKIEDVWCCEVVVYLHPCPGLSPHANLGRGKHVGPIVG